MVGAVIQSTRREAVIAERSARIRELRATLVAIGDREDIVGGEERAVLRTIRHRLERELGDLLTVDDA